MFHKIDCTVIGIGKLQMASPSGLEVSEIDSLVEEYKAQLNEEELKTLAIAEEHLGTSFDMAESIGFLEWSKDRTKKIGLYIKQ
jgi:hypothetical protein